MGGVLLRPRTPWGRLLPESHASLGCLSRVQQRVGMLLSVLHQPPALSVHERAGCLPELPSSERHCGVSPHLLLEAVSFLRLRFVIP